MSVGGESDAAIDVVEADLLNSAHIERLFSILDAYARGPGGQNAPLGETARRNLGPGLRDHPNAFVLFGRIEGEIVGAAVCVWSFSTFAGKPSVNLHDFSVLPEARGRGVGSALLAELEARARARSAAKVTLEVVATNDDAKRLYRRAGFQEGDPKTLFLTRPLD